MTPASRTRRGIVILVVLSLLVLFVLLVGTYAVVAGRYRRAAASYAVQELLGVPPQQDLESAMYQVLRDTRQPGSAVRFHSLLRDSYGEDGFRGKLADSSMLRQVNENLPVAGALVPTGAVTLSNGQFLDLVADPAAQAWRDTDGRPFTPCPTAGFYNGCVLTITSGKAAGCSTRIVGYLQANGHPLFRVLRIESEELEVGSDFWAAVGGAQFVVNGRAFNGTGFGFRYHAVKKNSVTVSRLDATVATGVDGNPVDLPVALLPNHASRPAFNGPHPQAELAALLDGGSDEGYDAADYQNLFLSMVKPWAASSRDIIPSFHRPELINYWLHQPSAAPGAYWADDDFKRLVSLRAVEPNFDGSNPNFNAVSGPWDVDNDGDGVPDSVWIDLGFPVQTARTGRSYKPLFAVLCVDLDGRLNVNAHGNPTGSYPHRPSPIPVAVGTTAGFPKGRGYGPPEIALSGVTGSLSGLFGVRYGGDGVPGRTGLDPLAGIKFWEEPENYFASGGGRSAYSSPPDLRGELAFGLDVFGQPAFEQIPGTVPESRADSPYEINLLDRTTADGPFTPAELEPILRPLDYDVSALPSRLRDKLDLATQGNARLVTTDSYDPPVPGISVPGELRGLLASANVANARNVAELLAARLSVSTGNVDAELTKLLAPDLALGLRMDINRPLGNGRDDDHNGIVDEPGESGLEYVWNAQGNPPAFGSSAQFSDVPFQHTGGLAADGGPLGLPDNLLARQLFARHLYVLMMTLIDQGGAAPEPTVARHVAQWAVNVVDFRDADSIMTAFEYNLNPFTGWTVDGDLRTDEGPARDVVWGCERPELLITETLAFHDRRTEDRDDDDGVKTKTTYQKTDPDDPKEPDPDFDQRLRPRGALFVELFNPTTGSDIVRPAELYSTASPVGVDLARVASDGVRRSPVWRLLFVKDGFAGKDPDEPAAPLTEETRRIYFVNPTVAGPLVPPLDTTGAGGDYWTSLPVAPLPPGQYAVAGSAGIRNGSDYVSPVGRLASITEADEADYHALRIDDTRRIVLSPSAAGNQVHVFSNVAGHATANADVASYPTDPDQPPPGPPDDNDLLPAQAIAIDQPRSFSISEPLGGYPSAGFDTSSSYEGTYSPIRDQPLDLTNDGRLLKNQTTTWGMIHLQRLANPTLPYDPLINPYRTTDSQRCDLTSFNGAALLPDPDSAGHTCFFAVQRGDTKTQRELWPQEPFSVSDPSQDWGRDPGLTHYFNFFLRSSLGCLNHGFWPYQGQAAGLYRGAPALDTDHHQVFSCLAWNNRPFVSQYELLQVPGDQSSQLLRNYSLPVGSSPYDTLSPSPQYGHLVNFFHAAPSRDVSSARQFYRIFDYVHVPSRFVGSETVFNPDWFGKGTSQVADPTQNPIVNPRLSDPARQSSNPSFLPPFNRVSKFRDPGRININTIYDRKVWDAILGGYAGCSFDALLASRRGFGGAGGELIPALFDPNFPSCVANPFRPVGCGSLVPLAHLERQDIETTLLRSGAAPTQPTSPDYPDAPPPGNGPLLEGGYVAANPVATDPRNSLFRYGVLNRLGNLVTTRSNVYAIWITVGYFEVEPNRVQGVTVWDAFHPDGYRVAQEIGIETGEVERHRAFYLVDRSIPVAFEPGENHNVDRCILLRRYIE